jgi:pimeloyl-ACP methyl ester carboxylesterase
VIGVDLPGFGGSRRRVSSLRAARVAAQLEALVDALRIARFDVVAAGWSVTPAAALAARLPARARRLLALGARPHDGSTDPERLRERVRAGLPQSLPAALRAELEAELAAAPGRNLRLAARAAALDRVGAVPRTELGAEEAFAGPSLFAALAPD